MIAPEGGEDREDGSHHGDDDDIFEGDAEVLEVICLDESHFVCH